LNNNNLISFKDISDLFNPKQWDIGYLSAEQLLQCSLSPVKTASHPFGHNFTNSIHFQGLTNAVVLIRDGHHWDYTHYDESVNILKNSNFKNWFSIYTNFKDAAILAGIGVRARNSLVYNYKFGFDCHITVIGFREEIVDIPTNKRINYKLWSRCKGCDDCITACPVGAIHGDKEPYWLNSMDCDNFIGSSDHPTIPSIKKFWHENVHPEFPKEKLDTIKTMFQVKETFGGPYPYDANGFTYDGQVVRKNGEAVNIPFCRECTSQPRCSKWNGEYPYEQYRNPKIISIKAI
jgi:ferredoxin